MTIWFWWLSGGLILFSLFEGYALLTRRIPTLSATVWSLTKHQPLLPFAIGLVVGVLAVHFWGHGWCPS